MKFMQKKIIYGCESRGDAESPYLTRWTLIETRFGAIYLHIFHRSDFDVMHDHPWDFCSVILWRGYWEQMPFIEPGGIRIRIRRWPFTFTCRPAGHIHRVELIGGKPAVTLVLRGPIKREWGFWEGERWTRWVEYFKAKGC